MDENDELIQEATEEFPHDIVRTMYEFLGFKNVVKGQYFLISQGWFDTFDQYCTDLQSIDIHEASSKDSKQLISLIRVQRLLRILQKTKRFKNTETVNFIFGEKNFYSLVNNLHVPLKIYDQGVVVALQGSVDSLNMLNNKQSFRVHFGCQFEQIYAFEADMEKSKCCHTPGMDTDPTKFVYNPVTFQNVPIDYKKEGKNPIITDVLFNLEFSFVANNIYVNLNDELIYKFMRITDDWNTAGKYPNEIIITTNNILWVRSLTVSYPMDLLVQNEEQIESDHED